MRLLLCAAIAALFATVISTHAHAQTPAAAGIDHSPLSSVFDADVLGDLPLGDTVYALLENTQAEVIADRFTSGGFTVGGDARVGGFLGSWSQTLFRVGDLDVSDPSGSGASLLSPDLAFWQRVSIENGMMPADINTPGLAVILEPRRGGTEWVRVLGGTGSGGNLAASAPDDRPVPIVRLKDFANGFGLVSGPLSRRTGLAAGVRVARGTGFRRETLPSTADTTASGFAHMTMTMSPTREWRMLGWGEGTEAPQDHWQGFQTASASTRSVAFHLQTTLESGPVGDTRWRIFGGFTQRTRTQRLPSDTVEIERITGGPVPNVADSLADTTVRRIEAGARFMAPSAPGAKHHVSYGANLMRSSMDTSDPFRGTIQELIDRSPARTWLFAPGVADSNRHAVSASAFAADRIRLASTATLDVGVQGEAVSGSATGAVTTVTWISVLPHASLRWNVSDRRALVFGYARSANRLNLDWLAFGDPGAPTAEVSPYGSQVVVSRVGPGTGGAPEFSTIDKDLKRPYTDEFVIGYEKRRSPSTRYTLTALARREGNLVGVVNTGVPSTGYETIAIPDAGKDLVNPSDDRLLLVYNRLPSTYGQDAYVVTNSGQEAASAFALRMTWEHDGERLFTLFGATASAATGSGSSRGYGPLENDQDIPGELFTNPNANSYARGRLFSDRAFTIKWTTLYRFPGDFTVGAIARYQDGQPFSRLVVVRTLNQGAEAVQAYPNAGSRFTFTSTLDLRAQKGFRIGATRVDAIVDAYNLLTRGNEVEEYVVSGPDFRTPTAIEPPPSVHLGLRLTF